MLFLALIAIFASFTLSASAGLGGSLIMVPAMGLILGAKPGVAVAALLLACNNIGKVIVYRKTIPLMGALWVMIMTMLGVTIGAGLMVAAPEIWVHAAIIISVILSFLFEFRNLAKLKRPAIPFLAFFAGATSGFSGTSGPLKGLALRNLSLDRLYFVGAASIVSLAGDATKTLIFANASLYTDTSKMVILLGIPLIPLAVLFGRHINRKIGEPAFAGLFWMVMAGYITRLVVS